MASNPATRRTVLIVAHTGRLDVIDVACAVAGRLTDSGIVVRMLEGEADALHVDSAEVVPADGDAPLGCELAVVIGGDGTILRAAEMTRLAGTPLVGINLGHVGFLAEAEWDDLDSTVDAIIAGSYVVEERLTVDVCVQIDGEVQATGWALNEVSVEKAARQRMLEVVVEIDGRPLSRWGCDGVVLATPTGSTAYAFSAGGPVVWPEVQALLLVPISAHALFARPLVVSVDSTLAVEVLAPQDGGGVVWCDGRRSIELPPGARVEVSRGQYAVRLARLYEAPFTDRLVAKFGLPVSGWRGTAERRRNSRGGG
ncbi:MAG: NAD kinase [Propionibacteriales bacterium]|nr:NAD kinase [Propionibacteriales bacterium]